MTISRQISQAPSLPRTLFLAVDVMKRSVSNCASPTQITACNRVFPGAYNIFDDLLFVLFVGTQDRLGASQGHIDSRFDDLQRGGNHSDCSIGHGTGSARIEVDLRDKSSVTRQPLDQISGCYQCFVFSPLDGEVLVVRHGSANREWDDAGLALATYVRKISDQVLLAEHFRSIVGSSCQLERGSDHLVAPHSFPRIYRTAPYSGRPLIVALATHNVLMNNFSAPDIAMGFSMLFFLHHFNVLT